MRPDVHVVVWCFESFVQCRNLSKPLQSNHTTDLTEASRKTNHVLNHLTDTVSIPSIEQIDPVRPLIPPGRLLDCFPKQLGRFVRDDPFVPRIPVCKAPTHAVSASGMTFDHVRVEFWVLALAVGCAAAETCPRGVVCVVCFCSSVVVPAWCSVCVRNGLG